MRRCRPSGWMLRVTAVGAVVGVLTPVRVYPDSVGYVTSAMSLFSPSFATQYQWLREPLYPLVLRVLLEFPAGLALHLVPLVQGIALAVGLVLFTSAAQGLGLLRNREVAAYYAMTCLLVSGYSGAVLQQTLIVLAAAAFAFCAVRLATGPPDRTILVLSAATGASAFLLSSIFLAPAALLPFAPAMVRGRRLTWPPFLVVWGSTAAATVTWLLIKVVNGQSFGLGGAAVLGRTNTTDWPLRIQAFLATFGLAPDFYNGVNFNTLSYSNVALGLNTYFGSPSCADVHLADLRSMPDVYAVCGSAVAPALPVGLLQPLTTFVLLQLVVGVVALVWAWSATAHVRLYGFVLVMTALPCLPVAFFLADGNSRYGLPILQLSLVLTVGMAVSAYRHRGARQTLRPTHSTD